MSEENMVEKVARALHKHRYGEWYEGPSSMTDSQRTCLANARIAIEAMRTPTDTMIDVACVARAKLYPAFEGEKPEPTAGDVAIAIWQAMIDATLKETA